MLISEDPDPRHAEAIRDLRKLAREDEEIQGSGLDLSDDFLGAFIYGKNGDLKKCIKTLKSYVQVRKGKYNEFFKTVIPNRCKYFLDIERFFAFFKHRDAEGRVIGYIQLAKIDFNVVDLEDIFRALVVSAEELMRLGEVTTSGLTLIIDCRGISFHHVKVFTPARVQFVFNILVGTYPIKYKGFHLLSDSYIFDPLLRIFKMFAPKKLRERIFLHGKEASSLHQYFSLSILPDWLGGELSVEDCYDYEFEDVSYGKDDYYRQLAMKW